MIDQITCQAHKRGKSYYEQGERCTFQACFVFWNGSRMVFTCGVHEPGKYQGHVSYDDDKLNIAELSPGWRISIAEVFREEAKEALKKAEEQRKWADTLDSHADFFWAEANKLQPRETAV